MYQWPLLLQKKCSSASSSGLTNNPLTRSQHAFSKDIQPTGIRTQTSLLLLLVLPQLPACLWVNHSIFPAWTPHLYRRDNHSLLVQRTIVRLHLLVTDRSLGTTVRHHKNMPLCPKCLMKSKCSLEKQVSDSAPLVALTKNSNSTQLCKR